jgi:hypothetical protein
MHSQEQPGAAMSSHEQPGAAMSSQEQWCLFGFGVWAWLVVGGGTSNGLRSSVHVCLPIWAWLVVGGGGR